MFKCAFFHIIITMRNKEIKGVIFDMDGVLFDSERFTEECMREACIRMGVPCVPHWGYRLGLGSTHEDCVRIFGQFIGDKEITEKTLRLTYSIELDHVREGIDILKPGALEIVNYLDEHSFPMVLATSSVSYRISILFENSRFHRQPFTKIVCGDDVVNGKPDPEVFLKAAARLDLPPHNCMVIEDSIKGLQASLAAGAITVMVPDMIGITPELENEVYCVKKDLYEVMEILKPSVEV